MQAAPLLVPWSEGGLDEAPTPRTGAVIVPFPVDASGPAEPKDIAAITYGATPEKKGLDRVLAAWAAARRDGEQLVVAGADVRIDAPGVRVAGRLAPGDYRALLRRARVFVAAPRREDYGIAQLEALADGCVLVTTTAPGPYAALPFARTLDPRLVVGDDGGGLARALRTALDDPIAGYERHAVAAVARFSRVAIDAVVRDELLPRLLR